MLDSNARPPGAIVVGLGEPAELSLGALRKTLRRGIFGLCRCGGRPGHSASASEQTAGQAAQALRLSALLIGAGEGGLDRDSCAQALLQAAAQAQQALALVSKGQALLTEIEIVELFEDRALATWGALVRR